MNALEWLARALAEETHETTPLTRRDVAARGFAGLVALGSLGGLGRPRIASATVRPCRSLASCLEKARAAATAAQKRCEAEYPDRGAWIDFPSLGCYLWGYEPAARKGNRSCLANCVPKKKSPRKPRRQGAPPPLPPNPYDDGGLCANCNLVGGNCCWGGTLPGGMCACATAGVDCTAYGCT